MTADALGHSAGFAVLALIGVAIRWAIRQRKNVSRTGEVSAGYGPQEDAAKSKT